MLKILKLLRECHANSNSFNEVTNKYLKMRRDYRNICKSKKEEYDKKLCTKINSVNSSSEWCSLVNMLKERPLTKKSNLEVEELRKYFYELLNTPLISEPFSYAEQR